MFYIGIDGGGTKSRLMAIDEAGRCYGPYQGGSTNIESNPVKTVKNHIQSLIDAFLQEQNEDTGSIAAVCLGSAGIDRTADEMFYRQMMKSILPDCPAEVMNDVQIALESEAKGGPGMVLVCGTGSVAFGRNSEGQTARAGGWGHLTSDEGSAYWIGREAIRRAFRSFDGREKPTILTERIREFCQIEAMEDVMGILYREGADKRTIAQMAPIAAIAALDGDRTACEIFDQAAEELFFHAVAVFDRLHLPRESMILLSGGVMDSAPLYDRLVRRLKERSDDVRRLRCEPCMGAVWVAKKIAGI